MHKTGDAHKTVALAFEARGRYRLRMGQKGPNYIWRKRVTAEWLRANEEQLASYTARTHALIDRPDRARIEIEFFCNDEGVARALMTTFGGTAVRLATDWKARLFETHKSKPLRIAHRLTIRSEPDLKSGSGVLTIPAGAAFGTGEHATTAMSLRLLERISRPLPRGWRMLDAGTGSGILALAARRFGAEEVIAVDNDPTAIRTARQNAHTNRIRGVRFIAGDATEHIRGRFDIIAANLYSDLLAVLLPRFSLCLRKDGRVILSGVLRPQEPGLTRALNSNGFRVLEARRRGKWVALLAGLRGKS